MRHTPTVGTVLSMTPASGRVRFVLDGEQWTLPLVGWAVVVTYVSGRDDDERDDGREEYEAHLDAVVLTEGRYPVPLSTYEREDLDGRGRVTVEPST